MTPGVSQAKNLDQFQMTRIPLLLYTKFHLFSMKYEKEIAFDITPFENSHTNLHTYKLLVLYFAKRQTTGNKLHGSQLLISLTSRVRRLLRTRVTA